jgi:hypothetical protein
MVINDIFEVLRIRKVIELLTKVARVIQYVVSPHCGDKKNGATLHETFSVELL